ncbi:MAG: 5-formyltetrahydrofolate cyclo-ligase [Burkholderiaceae bacterium]
MRQRMLAQRSAFADSPQALPAGEALAQHLLSVLATLEPQCLGSYWPVRSEFNANQVLQSPGGRYTLPLALPFVHKSPPRMEYRAWDGKPPTLRDEVSIPTAAGDAVVPDVVLVPCLGYTDEGYRLGYGGGYFDRWLAANPQVVAVAVAWEIGRIECSVFAPQPHDVTLALIVTERGVR